MGEYAFNCPACGGDMTVTDEDAGRDIICPHCQTGMTLPNWHEAEPEPEPVYRDFTGEDLVPLQANYQEVIDAFDSWANSGSYMHSLIGALLISRIGPFAHALGSVEPQVHHGGLGGLLKPSKSKTNQKLNEQCGEHLQRVARLLDLIDTHLHEILFSDDIEAAVGLADAIAAELDEMWQFYLELNEHSLGDDGVFGDLQEIIGSWVPWVFQNLLALAEDLKRRGTKAQRAENPLTWQVTLIPPNIHAFFACKAELT
jgi:hypothetical protein